MIKGQGLDIQLISAVAAAYDKRERFAGKVLTPGELARFEGLSGKRKYEYLAGRWAAKEAFVKAWGTGIGPVSFQDLEVLNDAQGAPYFSQSPHLGPVWVSISHTGDLVAASVILEEGNED